ncbi:hypothetical protein [Pseudosulfitobacter pseudonitzschiae]|uniref:hypothetical protein n=1 Tax=Pseudosulfitobacter pseudonitzschiae TaxID=1402135 RepID=UPI003B7BEE95
MKYTLEQSLEKIRDAVIHSLHEVRALHAGPMSQPVLEGADRVEKRGSYEDLDFAVKAALAWGRAVGEERLAHLGRMTHSDLADALRVIEIHDPVWVSIMPNYAVDAHGGAMAIPHMMKCPEGMVLCPGLGNAVLYNGVEASVFARPILAEPVYDGAKALAAGTVAGLPPVGVVATYKITVLDGELHHPPLWPSEALRRAEAKCENDTMEPEF